MRYVVGFLLGAILALAIAIVATKAEVLGIASAIRK